jgi:signal peptidase I
MARNKSTEKSPTVETGTSVNGKAAPEAKTAKAGAESKPAKDKSAKDKSRSSAGDGTRETIELVVVAFILAFLFRTFEAEAFVIPTGSMAPTLMGRHKDLVCEKCGYPYRVGASNEVHRDTGDRLTDHTGNPTVWVSSTVCPMCRYRMDLGGLAGESKFPSYKGDRILVGKFPYQIGEPSRWDVVVFKFPLGAQINYIKRLIGLPGETIWIVHGDIYAASRPDPTEADFVIQRKPPEKLLAMLQVVHDNDYFVATLARDGFPPRWQPWGVPLDAMLQQGWSGQTSPPSDNLPEGHWSTSDGSRSFSADGTAPNEVWLRYQHMVPNEEDWWHVRQGRKPIVEPQFIEDFNAYNHGEYNNHDVSQLRLPWVGDLVVSCEVQLVGETGEFVLELIEAGTKFQCRFDVATGTASVHSPALPELAAKAATPVKGPGTYRVAFANVDDELRLWVNGKVVQFESPTTYDSQKLGLIYPKTADYAPVGIASLGANMRVDHLQIHRDLYYRAVVSEYDRDENHPEGIRFLLGPDQFFVLGDNSEQSADSRLWGPGAHYVDRSLLIGKALFVYWPHSWDQIPGTEVPFPFYPNFARMGPVR